MFLSLLTISGLVFNSMAFNGPFHGIGPVTERCLRGDIDCIAAANMQAVIPCLGDGIPDLGIPGLEPMNLQNVTLDQGYFKLVLPATKIYGSKHCKVVSTLTDIHQSTSSVTLDCPLQAVGKYHLTAKSYIFDINNEGNFVFQSDLIRTTIKSKFETIYGNDGKQYRNLLDYEYFYEPLEKIHIELGNLFSGDIERGQLFLNFVPNGVFASVGKIAEPLVDSAVGNFHRIFKAALVRLPVN